jgi:Na+/proline symporter
MEGTQIYDLVAKAYQFPVVGAFWPLVCGLYWRRSTTQGAIWSIVLGMTTWMVLDWTPLGAEFPSVLGGFIMAAIGMVAGSLLPTQGNVTHRARTASHGPHSHAGHGHRARSAAS